jgi:dTDP-L-rhamnose 4-epimerase
VKVLVTGGAGFVGSRVVDILLEHGHTIAVLDVLSPQIHAVRAFSPAQRNNATCIQADVRDTDALRGALAGVEAVVHLAAETGTGQSMYNIRHYSDVNTLGTAGLLDLLVNEPHTVRRFVLASSRAVYGEGQYRCPRCGIIHPPTRPAEQLARHEWEIVCPICGGPAEPVPTREDALLQPQSIYASTKQTQEQLITIACQSRGIESVVLRYQNVYGPGQSLTNPYTGMISIFFSLIAEGAPLALFEDGLPSRDFVFIDDVAAATAAATEAAGVGNSIINVGTGVRTSVHEVAMLLYTLLEVEPNARVTGQSRAGDIRHCYADIARLRDQLGYTPQIDFTEGLRRFVAWAIRQERIAGHAAERFARAQHELTTRELFR